MTQAKILNMWFCREFDPNTYSLIIYPLLKLDTFSSPVHEPMLDSEAKCMCMIMLEK